MPVASTLGRITILAGALLLLAIHARAEEGPCAEQLLELARRVAELPRAPLVRLEPGVTRNQDLPFLPHSGPGRFDTSLAMNVRYAPVVSLRAQLARLLGRPLDYFKGWAPDGEAHVTVVTPVEYQDVLKAHVPMERIDAIARDAGIQQAPLEVLGIGCGRATLDGKLEETFFLIVESEELLRIRQRIRAEFVAAGGKPDAWDPGRFHPHITIGYTRRDLHEADGVLKDLVHGLDSRFNLTIPPGANRARRGATRGGPRR
jgi:2'-5' RNA ligase